MERIKLLCYSVIFLTYVTLWRVSRVYDYPPDFDYANDSFFSQIIKYPTKGIIISDEVRMNNGLNLQVATGKQYFMSFRTVLNINGKSINLHCDAGSDTGTVTKTVDECFAQRSLTEWQKIAEFLDSRLVMTVNTVQIPALHLLASNKYFNLYEIAP